MENLEDKQPNNNSEKTPENGVTRRQIIKTGAAAAGAIAFMGGFPNISSAQNKTLNIVRGTYFIPGLRDQNNKPKSSVTSSVGECRFSKLAGSADKNWRWASGWRS